MKAVICRAYGPPASLTVEDVPAPEPGPGELLVTIRAAGFNFFDTLLIAGKYQVKPPFPFSPCAEFAGVTPDGRRVMGYCGHGAAAEQIAIAASAVVDIPAGVTDGTAASLCITYGTTLHALEDRGALQAGETLVVLGAAGGTGQAAIELGKLMGARVIACASTPEKRDFCRSCGADAVIGADPSALKDEIRTLTEGRGADVVYDPVGGALAEPAIRALSWGGRYLVIGFASGEIPRIPLNLLLLKGADARGVFWGAFTQKEPERHRAAMQRLLAWCADGALKPHIHRTYRLEETADALTALSRREVMGKAVLVI